MRWCCVVIGTDVCICFLYVGPIRSCYMCQHGPSWCWHRGSVETSRRGTLRRFCFVFSAWMAGDTDCTVRGMLMEKWTWSLILTQFLGQQPQWARAPSFTRFLEHTQRRNHIWWDSSGRGISPKQRLLPDNTQHCQERERDQSPVRDSNPQFQQASGHRTIP